MWHRFFFFKIPTFFLFPVFHNALAWVYKMLIEKVSNKVIIWKILEEIVCNFLVKKQQKNVDTELVTHQIQPELQL